MRPEGEEKPEGKPEGEEKPEGEDKPVKEGADDPELDALMGAVEELCDDDEDCLNEVDEEVTNLEGECGDDDKECWKNGMEAKMEEMKKGKKEKKGKKGKKGDVM